MPLDDGRRSPTEGDHKPSLKNTVKRFAKALWRIALGAAVKTTADDIFQNIEELFSDVEVVKESEIEELFTEITVVKESEEQEISPPE